jgi:integrase
VKRTVTLEPGFFLRISPRTGAVLPTIWFHYTDATGRVRQQSAHTTSIRAARTRRAERVAERARGEVAPSGRVTIQTILTDLLADYARNERSSLVSVRGHVKAWLAAGIGTLRPPELRPQQITAIGDGWKRLGAANATINRRFAALRRAYQLACQTELLHTAPYFAMRDERRRGRRARYVPAGDAVALLEQLPTYAALFFEFALENGIRRGQLARTQRRFVDVGRAVIEWPPEECKSREPHVLPLEGRSLALVERALGEARPWCSYLFHGRWCRGGRPPSKKYGCVGDFRKAWAAACTAAQLPVGAVAGGYIFHDTRRTAATTLRAGGLDEPHTMQVGGWKTAHVFRNYDLGDIERLRDELSNARATAAERGRFRRRRAGRPR